VAGLFFLVGRVFFLKGKPFSTGGELKKPEREYQVASRKWLQVFQKQGNRCSGETALRAPNLPDKPLQQSGCGGSRRSGSLGKRGGTSGSRRQELREVWSRGEGLSIKTGVYRRKKAMLSGLQELRKGGRIHKPELHDWEGRGYAFVEIARQKGHCLKGA